MWARAPSSCPRVFHVRVFLRRVFLRRRPAPQVFLMGIPRTPVFLAGYSSGGRSSSTGYSTLDNARWGSPKPEDIGFGYSSGIPQSYSQLPRKPAGVVFAALTDLPQGVFLGRRPSSVGIPRVEACPVLCQAFHNGFLTDADLPWGLVLGRKPQIWHRFCQNA